MVIEVYLKRAKIEFDALPITKLMVCYHYWVLFTANVTEESSILYNLVEIRLIFCFLYVFFFFILLRKSQYLKPFFCPHFMKRFPPALASKT